MAPVDFASDLLEPNYAQFSRNIIVSPVASAPATATYAARGIYGTQSLDILGEDTLVSDQQTILDIIEKEFLVLPQQGDRINIPADGALPALGTFEVVSSSSNGGGETTLEIRKWETAAP